MFITKYIYYKYIKNILSIQFYFIINILKQY